MGYSGFRYWVEFNILKPSTSPVPLKDISSTHLEEQDPTPASKQGPSLHLPHPSLNFLCSEATQTSLCPSREGACGWMYTFPTEHLNCIWIILGYCHLVFPSSLTVNNPLSLYGYLEYIYRERPFPLSLLLRSRWLPCWREVNGEESCILPPLKNKATQI